MADEEGHAEEGTLSACVLCGRTDLVPPSSPKRLDPKSRTMLSLVEVMIQGGMQMRTTPILVDRDAFVHGATIRANRRFATLLVSEGFFQYHGLVDNLRAAATVNGIKVFLKSAHE